MTYQSPARAAGLVSALALGLATSVAAPASAATIVAMPRPQLVSSIGAVPFAATTTAPPAPEADPLQADSEDAALLQPLPPGETVPRADPAVMRRQAAEEVARRLSTGTLGRNTSARGSNPQIIELNAAN